MFHYRVLTSINTKKNPSNFVYKANPLPKTEAAFPHS